MLLKQKSPPVAGGQSMIVWLIDQSRHRAAKVQPCHQRATVRAAAMAFRCVIGRLGR